MNIVVHQDRCISSGLCASRLPSVFTQTADEGVVELVDDQPPSEDADEVREAAIICPSQAIEFVE